MGSRVGGLREVSLVSVLEFDSEWFGKRIGRRDGNPEETDLWAKANELDCVYTLLRLNQMNDLHWAVQHGFRLVDVRVEFIARSARLSTTARPAKEEDWPDIERIARTSFKKTRFHNDRWFDRERVNEMYANWARTSGEALVTYNEDGGVAGFVTVGDTHLELIAVDETLCGHGHGDRLANAALKHAYANGNTFLNVVTQGGNHAAQRTFQAVGFRLISTHLWLHKWYLK